MVPQMQRGVSKRVWAREGGGRSMCLHTYLNICLHIPQMSISVHDVLPGGDDGDLSRFLLHLLHYKCVGVGGGEGVH